MVLLALYFVLKWIPKEYIDIVLGGYFTLAGMFAVYSTMGYILNGVAEAIGLRQSQWHVRVSRGFRREWTSRVRRQRTATCSKG